MIYLKADDEATFTAALKTAGWAWDTEYQLDEDGNRVQVESGDVVLREAGVEAYSATHSLDIIGVIHAETGETITVEATDDMPEHTYPETAPIDGWHANLLLHGEELPDALSGFAIEAPTVPVRRFA
jgi:hypothetical protein